MDEQTVEILAFKVLRFIGDFGEKGSRYIYSEKWLNEAIATVADDLKLSPLSDEIVETVGYRVVNAWTYIVENH